ncbi:hypothetical protein L248_1459 [Schleiferilactobacillus shenzhenensis LY-73]|uniref:Uncharacterized protein n=1 Tax=Schleiferilactobacillus shenzhenensis LY-73 TaxID=1231336 RepID=U4THI7_9LACO|nr:hypothetical protein L248_1459 [Schleiferilactobacillus shenzhenensis LY-73]
MVKKARGDELKTYLWWQWRITRRIVPLVILFLTVTGGAALLFIHSLTQQKQYVAQYKTDIQFDLVRRDKKTAAADKWLNTWILPELHNERNALSSPEQYASGFAKSLNVLVHPTPADGQPSGLRKQFSSLVVPYAQFFGGQEMNTTLTELALVKKRRITPMYPARLLLNEQSVEYFSANPALYSQYVQKVAKRFYERAWYFLQYLISQNGGLVLGAIVSFALAWRYALQMSAGARHNNTFLVLGVTPTKQYWLSTLFNWGVAFAFVTLSVGLFLLLSAWRNGWGALNYPILLWRGDAVMSSHGFANLGTVLSDEALLFFASLLFGLSFAHLLSVLVKQPLTTLLATVSLWGVPLVAPSWRWAPWTYFNFSRVADGYAQTFFQTYDARGGTFVLLGWTVLFITLGALWLKVTERGFGGYGDSGN